MVEAIPDLNERELTTIVDLVYSNSGIVLHDGKRALIRARLQKRLRTGGFPTFSEYLAHLRRDQSGEELAGLLDAIATNHTSFFREAAHFDFLRERVVPELVASRAAVVRGWSAACSTGEEPYTLAMTLLEALPDGLRDRLFIQASDISTKALATARAGVFGVPRIATVPRPFLSKYFDRGLGEQDGLARVRPAIRRPIEFRHLNLLGIDDLGQRFNFIFCRNVMIYFDTSVRQRVVAMLERHLAPGGYLFVSYSETLNGLHHQLQWIAPAVYQRRMA